MLWSGSLFGKTSRWSFMNQAFVLQIISVFNNIFKGVSSKYKTKKKKQNRNWLHLYLGKVNFQMQFIWITIRRKLKSYREIEEDWRCAWWIIVICKEQFNITVLWPMINVCSWRRKCFNRPLKIQKRASYFQRSFGRKRKDLENDEMSVHRRLRWTVTQKDVSEAWKSGNIGTRQSKCNVWI